MFSAFDEQTYDDLQNVKMADKIILKQYFL